jgi:hypothetical protein
VNRNSSALQQGERDGEYTIVADKSKSKSKKQVVVALYCINLFALHGEVACKKSFVCFFWSRLRPELQPKNSPPKNETKNTLGPIYIITCTCIHLLYNTIQLWLS